MSTKKRLQLVAFQGEQQLSRHLGSLEDNKIVANLLDADFFRITDPENPKTMIFGERESPEDIEWKEVMVH